MVRASAGPCAPHPGHFAALSLTSQQLVQTEGMLRGLTRGLGHTIAREVPGNAIYFSTCEAGADCSQLISWLVSALMIAAGNAQADVMALMLVFDRHSLATCPGCRGQQRWRGKRTAQHLAAACRRWLGHPVRRACRWASSAPVLQLS